MNGIGTQKQTPGRPPVACLAGRILEAIRRGDLADLETGLAAAECCRPHCPGEPVAAERLELLAAVATRLRCSMARFERRLTPRPQGFTVYVRLLHHLAHSPQAATGPARRASSP